MYSFQDIADRVTIADILRDHGFDVPGETGRIACPIHGGRNRTAFSFKQAVFNCFGCGEKGTHIDLVCALRGNCSRPEALNWLEVKSGIKLNGDRESVINQPPPKPVDPRLRLARIIRGWIKALDVLRGSLARQLQLLPGVLASGEIDTPEFHAREQKLDYRLEGLDALVIKLTNRMHKLEREVN